MIERAVGGTIPTFGKANHADIPARAAGKIVAANTAGDLNAAAVAELKAEQAKIEAAKAKAAAGSAGGGSFLGGRKPVPGGGNRHGGYGWAAWAGDFPNASGTRVGAWAAGRVTAVNRWGHSYGNHVRIDHGKWRTLYAHLSSIAVSKGSTVKAGNVVGRVGSTGNSSGPHSHFEKYGNGTMGARAGFGWAGDKGAELVVNPQLRRFAGGEQVLNKRQTERVLSGGSGSLIGSVTLQTSDRARDAVGELTHALRVIDQGGPYAAV